MSYDNPLNDGYLLKILRKSDIFIPKQFLQYFESADVNVSEPGGIITS